MASGLYTIQYRTWGSYTASSQSSGGAWTLLHDVLAEDYFYDSLGNYDGVRRILQVTNPELKMEMNAAGSLTFTVPPNHRHYNTLRSRDIRIAVAVFRDGSFLWGGHPLTIDEDLYGNLTYTCEGVLGWLSDVVAPTFRWTSSNAYVSERFEYVLNTLYSYGTAMSINSATLGDETLLSSYQYRLFSSVKCSIDEADESITRYTDKNLTILEILQTRFLDYFGGYLKVGLAEDQESAPYGWWTLEYAKTLNSNTLTLEVGKNITSLTKTIDYTDFYTAVAVTDGSNNRVLSENVQASAYGDLASDYYYKPVNSATFINVELAGQYGVITKYVDATLDNEDFASLSDDEQIGFGISQVYGLAEPAATIEVNAVDTSILQANSNYLDIGKTIVYIDRDGDEMADMVVEEMNIRLDDPTQNTITLNGTLKKLSERVK